MQNYKRATLLSLILLTVVVATAMAALRNQGQSDQQIENQEWRNQFPVTDINAPESTNKLRQTRNSRYDIHGNGITKEKSKDFTIKETDPPVVFDLTPSHAPSLDAIPARQSDAIVVGEVISSEAHLSNDKTNVYSEFQVRIEEVIQNTVPETLFSNAIISTERTGGRVRFPSGKVLLRGVIGRNMPQIQARYAFFLKYYPEGQSFSIITAYELRKGRVFPLDGTSVPSGESDQFAVYNVYKNMEEATFINDVISAIKWKQK